MRLETPSKYETRAREIAESLGLVVTITPGPVDKCPTWSGGARKFRDCPRCGSIHGRNYWITLARKANPRQVLAFDFWGSYADATRELPSGAKWPKHPGIYDVLACVASDATMPTDPDDVVEEMGEMKPSQAVAVADFAKRLRWFFSDAEIAKLAEIDQ